MSGYSGKRLEQERLIERQYYANTLRVNMLALVQMTDSKYPWASDEWQQSYPDLSRFLNEADSEYGKTEEDYFNLISQYHDLIQKDKWLLESYHESLDKHHKKYVLPKPKNLKTILPYIISLIIGVTLGWLFF